MIFQQFINVIGEPHADPAEQPDNRWPAEQHQKGKALLNVSEELAQWRPVKQDFHFYSHLPAENQSMFRKVFRAASIQAIIPLCISNLLPYKPDQVNKVLMIKLI